MLKFRYNAHTDWLKTRVNLTMRWFSITKFHISRLQVHRQKKQMERESSIECSVFFSVNKGKRLVTKLSFEEFNDVFFTGKRKIACLKCNQGSEVFEDFFFSLYGQENYVFKREFMYV